MANRELAPSTGLRSLTPFERDPFASFRRQMDRLFDDFLAPQETRSFASVAAWPSIDVHENEQVYKIAAELPGLEQKDVEVTLRDNVLTIRGEKREERKQEEGGRTYAERTFGRFERSIPFDTEVDADKVKATFKNGVLTVEAPKNPSARDRAHRIEIRPQ